MVLRCVLKLVYIGLPTSWTPHCSANFATMNTFIFVALCAFVAYTSALPYPSEVVPETAPKSDILVAVDTGSEGESLVPAESAWGGHGWGHGGGRGWGHGGHHGWGHGGGWGHHGGHYGGHYGGHHGHHHWGR